MSCNKPFACICKDRLPKPAATNKENPIAVIAAQLQLANPLLNWHEALGAAQKVWEAHGGQ